MEAKYKMDDFERIIIELKEKIENSPKKLVYMKYRNFLNKFGIKSRNSQKIELIYNLLDKYGIGAYAYLDEGWTLAELPLDEIIRFKFKDQEINNVNNKQNITNDTKTIEVFNEESSSNQVKDSEMSIISIPDDFFKYLFDFGSEHEYERFQSCLDSEFPIGIFLCPKKEDFFSEIVERLLSLEVLRKHQYRNIQDNLRSTKLSLQSSVEDSENLNQQDENIWLTSDIFHFNQSTLYNVILGDTGYEIIESEKFDETLQKLALYTAKYHSKQKFILFHCPSENKIKEKGKQDVLRQLINTVSKKLPYVFTLKCKYEEDKSVENRKDIINHFKILLEVPNHEIEIDADYYSLMEIFLELQKVQLQSESQILLKLKPEYFHRLEWGSESDEHIYLKYFGIKTLEEKGYKLENIVCEEVVSQEDEIDKKKYKRRLDINVQNEVVVEIETLRSKGSDNNVFLRLIKDFIEKMKGWKNSFREFWLVLPGFEIARNYYQLKKVKEILEHKIKQKGSQMKIFIMMPDYENHRLLEVSFDKIRNPSFEFYHICNKNIEYKKEIIKKKLDFDCVKGLEDEKKRLLSIIQLYDKGYKTGIKGILFFGLPGCGKTLLANAFANKSCRYFFKFSPADIISIWIGQTQKNIRDIFSQAKLKAPSLLFIDELDSIGFSRDEFHAHTDQKASINQMLIELQNIEDHDVIVVAATNRLSGIDSALKRSGRLDWKIPIFPPDAKERKDMFEYYLDLYSNELKNKENINIELTKVNYEEIGKLSSRFTSSDIKLVCRELINNFLLEGEDINTQTIIKYIENYKKGGLTLKLEDVEEFIRECSVLSSV